MPPSSTKYSTQNVWSLSFDETFGVATVELLGFDSVGNVLRRIQVDSNGYLMAQTGTIPVFGQKTQSGSATALIGSPTPVKNGVIIQGLSTNSASIYVGGSGVLTTTGFELQPGQATSIAINDISAVYIIGTSGDGVCYIAAN